MRLALSSKTELAIRALNELTSQGPGITTPGRDLAQELGTTRNYLPQVMAPLVRRGWVSSTVGPTGGYTISTPSSAINLLEVIEAVEGSPEDGRCVLTRAPCPDQGPCAMHSPWSRARETLLDELADTPVAAVGRRVPYKEGSDA